MSSEDLPACVVPRRKLPSSSSVMPRSCDVSDLSRPYSELSQYRVLGVIGGQVMLVLCSQSQQCYAMKVIQKTCNQVPDEEFFTKSSQDNRLPVLPVDVPYMVKLAALIETPNLVFLVLQYVSGGKLFDYIDNYSRSVPETPQREVNLDNVFIDPEKIKKKNNLMDEPVLNDVESVKYSKNAGESKQIKFCESNDDAVNLEMSVTDIVINSQRLLLNVDDALSGRFLDDKKVSDVGDGDEAGEDRSRDKLTVMVKEVEDVFDGLQQKLEMILDEDEALKFDISTTRSALPPKTLCKWAAELLTAIDHLHQCGVICRNLSPENLLLGDHGHLMLTFMVGRCHQEAVTSLLASTELYVAPELLQPLLLTDRETYYDERAADFWSYGALLYELITGIKLSVVHPTGFNSHTILNFPRNLSHDAEALLSELLCFDPSERLGSGDGGVEDIKSHAYFKHIDWHIIEEDYIFDSK